MQNTRRSLLVLALAVAAAPATAQNSQISLDGSLPHGRTDILTGPGTGPEYVVSEDLGWRSGANLFHSFLRFDVATGETARFTSDTSLPPLANVIARVTGGDASDIDGTLRTTDIPTADFYLLNPAGVLFGGGASIDVPRSLYVSTASELVFDDETQLDLVDRSSPNLSVEPPAAFGFTGGAPAASIVFGNPTQIARSYRVADGHTLSAVGGDVSVPNRARLQAFGGRVQLVATGAEEVVVPLDAAGFELPATGMDSLGDIQVSTLSTVDTLPFDPSVPQGTIVIRGGSFTLADRSLVRAGDRIGGDGAAVDVAVTGAVDVSTNSEIRSESLGARDSGEVRIEAGEINLEGGSIIRSRVLTVAPGAATGGDVSLQADSIQVAGSRILSIAGGSGAGGDLILDASHVAMDASELSTSTTATGAAGDIHITAGQVDLTSASIVSTGSSASPSGGIQLDVDGLRVEGVGARIASVDNVTTPSGSVPEGGSVHIAATGAVEVIDGGVITTQTTGLDPGGDISITASSIQIAGAGLGSGGAPSASAIETGASAGGPGGSIRIATDTLRIGPSEASDAAGLLATAVAPLASGEGGSIDIAARSVELTGGGQISTTTMGVGAAGSIEIAATGGLSLSGSAVVAGVPQPSGVFSRSETNAAGGDVTISANAIHVEDAAEISTRARGTGASGDLTLDAVELVRVAGAGSVVAARGVDGVGGNLLVEADTVEVLGGGSIDVSTSGAGPGGLLTVNARDVLVSGTSGPDFGSALAAQADGTGAAVGIEVTATERVRVTDGGRITALSRGLGGSPGNVSITAPEIEISGGLVTAEAGAGTGGNVALTADVLSFLAGAEITARSRDGGDAGTISLVAGSILGRDSTITADADAFGGNIEIDAGQLVLERASLIALSRGEGAAPGAFTSGVGAVTPAGGNISIAGGAVVLNQSRIIADGRGNANGGFIDITADPWLRSGDSVISASSEFGLDGFVIVNTPYGEVTGDLAALPETFLDASSLLAEPCLARDAPSGSFAVDRARGVAPPPDAPIPAEPAGEPQQCEAP